MSSSEHANTAPVAGVENNLEQQNGQQQRPGGWKVLQSVMGRMLMFYFAMQAMNYFKGKPVTSPASQNNYPASGGGVESPGNIFAKGTKFDMYVYLSESDSFKEFDDQNALYWYLPNIDYGNWYMGPNNDGILLKNSRFELTKVHFLF